MSGENSIDVRRATIDDIPMLEAFYDKVYGRRKKYKYPERWHWLMSSGDLGHLTEFPVYIAVSDGRVVGHNAALRVNCKLFDRTVPLAWSIDTYVFKEYRGSGLGSQLQKLNRQDHNFFASLAMTPTNQRLKIKLGAHIGPSSKLYCKIFKFRGQPEIMKQRYKGFSVLAVGLGFVAFSSIRAIGLVKERLTGKEHKTLKTSDPKPAIFDEHDSELWRRSRERYDFAVERDQSYLSWRYTHAPWMNYYCIRAYDTNNKLSGLLVFRLADEAIEKSAVICELFDREGDISVIAKLLEVVEGYLRRIEVVQVQVASSDNILINILAKKGYLQVENRPLVIDSKSEDLSMVDPDISTLLTKGDHDWDQYPRFRFYDVVYPLYQWLKRVTQLTGR
ncbi:GNAT family N-acetyltransferase [Marinobacter sp. HL-58]|uniref:GNAT family N-acetyltransferase n=1 Tax=Marinobacter sp. HL-58 TaxID=1479237 RepID=UPI0006DBCC55|nr:GNAT family N-acetyltransferase [Marinobacter sp. HL-58]KPQ01371.1 MAG: Acetyltransferase (GNAT) domain [Marinobacter sp. HL-58]